MCQTQKYCRDKIVQYLNTKMKYQYQSVCGEMSVCGPEDDQAPYEGSSVSENGALPTAPRQQQNPRIALN